MLTLSFLFNFLLCMYKSFRILAYFRTCLMTLRSGMFTATFLNMSNISLSLSSTSIFFIVFTPHCGIAIDGTYSFSVSTTTSQSSMGSTTFFLLFSGVGSTPVSNLKEIALTLEHFGFTTV